MTDISSISPYSISFVSVLDSEIVRWTHCRFVQHRSYRGNPSPTRSLKVPVDGQKFPRNIIMAKGHLSVTLVRI